MFDYFAHIHEDDVVGNAAGLAEDMGDYHDCKVGFYLLEFLVYETARDGVEGRGGFIGKYDVGVHGQSACKTKPLLLSYRQS